MNMLELPKPSLMGANRESRSPGTVSWHTLLAIPIAVLSCIDSAEWLTT